MIAEYTRQRIDEALSQIRSAISTLDSYIADLAEADIMERELDELRGSYENLKQEWSEMKEADDEEEPSDLEDWEDEDDNSDLVEEEEDDE